MDPAVVPFLMEQENITTKEVDNILNKKSGLLGVSGIGNDMRQLNEEIAKGNERAKLAIDMFFYRIKKYIGAYMGIMNGLDAIVFTAGIGENNPWLIERVKKEMSELISKFKVEILVIPTKEEWMIAMETNEIIKKS